MAYTRFGEFVRILRIKSHEVMGDTAKMLGVSVPFLSAVENGKKNVPTEWIDKLVAYYHLSPSERLELVESIEESKIQYKLTMRNAGLPQRRAALQFARSFDKMDDETALKIIELLKKEESSKGGL